MKKLLALVLALALVLSTAVVFVSADDNEPDGYLWLKGDGDNDPGINFKVPGNLIKDAPITIKALVKFSEDCEPNEGCVYLNMYSYEQDAYNDWTYLISFLDYAKDSTVEKGKWVEIDTSEQYPTLNPYDGSYKDHAGKKCTPAMLTLGIGFYLATGTIYVGYIAVEQDGEEIWSIDFSNGFDVDDSDDLALVVSGGLFNMTAENKDVDWGSVSAVVEVSEDEPASQEPAPVVTKDVNLAAGKTYTVSGNKPRTDGYADNETGKLTDGLPGGNEASQNYLGFQGVAEEGADQAAVEVVIDLGESKEFKKITADAIYGDWGIAAPAGVKFAVSADGETYGDEIDVATENAEETVGGSDWKLLLYAAEGTFNGRYVKVTYYKANDGQSNHIWTSEIEVIGEEAADPGENSQGGNTPTTGDAGIIALAIVSVIALGGAVIVKKSK